MDSRQKLVESAQKLFWHQGYSTTSPREVMTDAGVKQGSYYHHFATKSALGTEAVVANGRELVEAVRAATDSAPTGRDKVVAFLSQASSALEGCRVGGFAYDAGVLADPDMRSALDAAFGALTDLVESFVAEGQQDGSLSGRLDAKPTAAALVAVVEGAFVTARATGRQASADAATGGVLALLLAS